MAEKANNCECCQKVDEVLDLLRGRINDHKDSGLCGEVQQLRREVNSIEGTHRMVKKWAIGTIIAALATFAKTAWTWVISGQMNHQN